VDVKQSSIKVAIKTLKL